MFWYNTVGQTDLNINKMFWYNTIGQTDQNINEMFNTTQYTQLDRQIRTSVNRFWYNTVHTAGQTDQNINEMFWYDTTQLDRQIRTSINRLDTTQYTQVGWQIEWSCPCLVYHNFGVLSFPATVIRLQVLTHGAYRSGCGSGKGWRCDFCGVAVSVVCCWTGTDFRWIQFFQAVVIMIL